MSLYEAAKDVAKIAQKADNIELYQKVLDLQSQALDAQEKLQDKNTRIYELESEIKALQHAAKYSYEDGHRWLIKEGQEGIKLCAVCFNRDSFENPLPNSSGNSNRYCSACKTYSS